MGKKLEVLANIVIVTSGILLCVVLVARVRNGDSHSLRVPSDLTGRSLAGVNGLGVEQSARSVLLYLNSGCRYCTESIPFYVRLSQLPSVKIARFRVVVLTDEPTDVIASYLGHYGIKASAIVKARDAGVRLPGTPSVLVVDRNGHVLGSWFGWLAQEQQAEVLSALATDG